MFLTEGNVWHAVMLRFSLGTATMRQQKYSTALATTEQMCTHTWGFPCLSRASTSPGLSRQAGGGSGKDPNKSLWGSVCWEAGIHGPEHRENTNSRAFCQKFGHNLARIPDTEKAAWIVKFYEAH